MEGAVVGVMFIDFCYQGGMHTDWLETTVAIGDSIMETDGVTVGDATVEKEGSERQTKTVLRHG